MDVKKYNFDDFTEGHYRKLLQIAKNKFYFRSYIEYKNLEKSILWRHDVDASIHRALSLAKIESDVGVHSTYFLYLHSNHYNLFEEEIISLVDNIIGLNHDIGLHFDPFFYEGRPNYKKTLVSSISFERKILENLFNIKITALSIHQPDTTKMLDLQPELLVGMVNSYSDFIKKNYFYCSDSNGYWR